MRGGAWHPRGRLYFVHSAPEALSSCRTKWPRMGAGRRSSDWRAFLFSGVGVEWVMFAISSMWGNIACVSCVEWDEY